jgi:hypothetical protein
MIYKLKIFSIVVFIFLYNSAHGTDISVQSRFSFDNYNLYYNYYSLKINNLVTKYGTFTIENFYDDFGLSNNFNGINSFSGSILGSRIYLNNNHGNLYYQIALGSDNFSNLKEQLFYDFTIAYLIPLDSKNSLVLNAKLNRYRFFMNPMASYLDMTNQVFNFSAQFRLQKAFIEASYSVNHLNETEINNNLLLNDGLITSIPKNKLHSFYTYAYTSLFKDINLGIVYSLSNSDINVYQPTFVSFEKNYYTYLPYFTPIESKAFSLLFMGGIELKLGSLNLGKISFKAQLPIFSSTKLLYEVKEGIITDNDSVYYDYSGVEPLKIDLSFQKGIGNSGITFVVDYTYFDKPYLKNAYFSDQYNGYKNHQVSFKIIKTL